MEINNVNHDEYTSRRGRYASTKALMLLASCLCVGDAIATASFSMDTNLEIQVANTLRPRQRDSPRVHNRVRAAPSPDDHGSDGEDNSKSASSTSQTKSSSVSSSGNATPTEFLTTSKGGQTKTSITSNPSATSTGFVEISSSATTAGSTASPTSLLPPGGAAGSNPSPRTIAIMVSTILVAFIVGLFLLLCVIRRRRRQRRHASAHANCTHPSRSRADNEPPNDSGMKTIEISQTVTSGPAIGASNIESLMQNDLDWDPESTFAKPFMEKPHRDSLGSQTSSLFRKFISTSMGVTRVPKLRIRQKGSSVNLGDELEGYSVGGSRRFNNNGSNPSIANKPLPAAPIVARVQIPPKAAGLPSIVSSRTSTIFHLDRHSSPASPQGASFSISSSNPKSPKLGSRRHQHKNTNSSSHKNARLISKFSWSTPTTRESATESTSGFTYPFNQRRSYGARNDDANETGTINTEDSEPRFRTTSSWVLHQQAKTMRNNSTNSLSARNNSSSSNNFPLPPTSPLRHSSSFQGNTFISNDSTLTPGAMQRASDLVYRDARQSAQSQPQSQTLSQSFSLPIQSNSS
ncbi:hypothetical protein FQN57_003941 [Myotisia sp. PD_48]|nr:hypothetical protein FQN57_003941 [Myotisia sp. PD_48]